MRNSETAATVRWSSFHKEFPGPRGHWFSGCAAAVHRDPLAFYTQLWQEYGDYVRFPVFRATYHLLAHPSAVEHVLVRHYKNYPKPEEQNRMLGLLLGNGLLTSEGETWFRQRRLAQPAFLRKSLGRLGPATVTSATGFVRRSLAVPGEAIEVFEEMRKVGLEIVSRTLFSTDLSRSLDAIRSEFKQAAGYAEQRMKAVPLIPEWLQSRGAREFARSKKRLDSLACELIESRKEKGEGNDLLGMLLAGQDNGTDAGMTIDEIKSEVLAILTAGLEATVSALTWMWYLLGKHPPIQEELYAEVRALLQGRSPCIEDLARLPLVKAVFDETMRLYPPAWIQTRQAVSEDVINGLRVPPKGMIVLSQWITHRHPEFWEDPESFKPQRFLDSRASARPRFAYFPFGAGPRTCIGNTFALIEGPLLLATIIQQLRVELEPGQTVVPDTPFTLRPKHGLRIRHFPRQP